MHGGSVREERKSWMHRLAPTSTQQWSPLVARAGQAIEMVAEIEEAFVEVEQAGTGPEAPGLCWSHLATRSSGSLCCSSSARMHRRVSGSVSVEALALPATHAARGVQSKARVFDAMPPS